jgi:hypothetical protein
MIIGKAISPFALRKKNGGGGGNDADAQAFITATGISGTNATATNQLVIDLKAANIWTKMKAIYPMVGNTASSQKYNLKDARDLDAAYRLVFSGGGTFSSNGMLSNAINSYADTFLNPATVFPSGFSSVGIYNRVSIPNLGSYIGCVNAASTSFISIKPNTQTSMRQFNRGISFTARAIPNALGFFANSRISNTSLVSIDNVGNISSSATSTTIVYPSFNLFLLTENTAGTTGGICNGELAFAYIADSLTSAELTSLRTINLTFQTTLGRQV